MVYQVVHLQWVIVQEETVFKTRVLHRLQNNGVHLQMFNIGNTTKCSKLGTPPNVQNWGTPPNVQYWGTLPNAQPWGVPPNGPSWKMPPNVQ